MSARSRRKGSRIERELVELHRGLGIAAERVPLSGAAGGAFSGDVVLPGIGRAEVKARGNGAGFATLDRWLGDNAALFLRRDRAAPLVLLPWATYARFLKGFAVAQSESRIRNSGSPVSGGSEEGFANPEASYAVARRSRIRASIRR